MTESSFKTKAIFKTKNDKSISSQLEKILKNKDEAYKFLETNISSNFHVSDIKKRPTKKAPAPPFTTSTLQQEASRKLYFSVSKTMNVAQRLYEAGYITYMRTDSVNLSEEAKNNINNQIKLSYGDKYLQIRQFKTKNKGAQEAHEAIRPTNFSKKNLNIDYDQARLYELIWRRALASQMRDAELEKSQILIKTDDYNESFTAKGEIITFDGFLKLYLEGVDDEVDDDSTILPQVKIGEEIQLDSITATERFSRPPFRYSEASLVKKNGRVRNW